MHLQRLWSVESRTHRRLVAPFVVLSLLGVVAIALPPRPTSWWPVATAVGLTFFLMTIGLVVPWRRLPSWLHPVVPLGYFVVIALLRDAQGGASSGYAPLAMLPIFWLALYGTRRHLVVGIAALTALYVTPLLLGAPSSEWRRAILWVAVAGLVGTWVQDLTARVRVRGREARDHARRLETAERALAASVARSPTGIAVTDLNGVFVSANPALGRMLGRRPEELVGRTVRTFSHPDDADGTTAVVAELATGERLNHVEEKRYLRPDGEPVWVFLSISVVPGEDGRPVELLNHFVDITDRKRAEGALLQTEANLRAVGRVARDLALTRKVRATLCDAAAEVTGGNAAFLYEPVGRSLVPTARFGLDVDLPALSLAASATSGCVTSFLSATRIFSSDALTDGRVSNRLAGAIGARSAVFEPIVHQGSVLGVLIVTWEKRVDELDAGVSDTLHLLAAEGAVALERESLYRRLEENARLDGLTGIPNRRSWDEALARVAADERLDDSPLSVAILDLDHFKHYNDTHGHQAGDELLRTVARSWQAELRSGDMIARYGGEEFGVILRHCDSRQAAVIVRRLASLTPEGETCSAGYAQWSGNETPTALVARADAALYRAKEQGRDRVELARPHLAALPSEGSAA